MFLTSKVSSFHNHCISKKLSLETPYHNAWFQYLSPNNCIYHFSHHHPLHVNIEQLAINLCMTIGPNGSLECSNGQDSIVWFAIAVSGYFLAIYNNTLQRARHEWARC
jgi:hypothetical protein